MVQKFSGEKGGDAQTYYFNTENGSYMLKEAFIYGSAY
ncbi:hypothetical protein HBHAL_1297 [Halobacillus halophilus DSM 2266]|uniref:Uncharacterized protein n=1 Tax=Halobacillus halophilus (strain ATCC 35676 / DSM 2266 / JCM 20832 / KCTC 3685 / LMG 17431 / NBRC 102448 / NCIMB 2269) TaxID=866895 RepID=I0JHQ5_HALH3|nr:hypothetical protein HBHAL_1297 [Halobacillus halophilus DSM 2266]